ncbi:MAG: NUDIX domain-containing protein [Candidatus Rhabdochlamydia sp.]
MTQIHETSFGIIPLIQTEEGWKTLLICHTQGGHWAFPKGRKDQNESALETATRELVEETGLEIERLLSTHFFIEQYELQREGNLILKTVCYFPAIVRGELKLQEEEVSRAQWILLQEAHHQLTFEKTQHMYQAALSYLQL